MRRFGSIFIGFALALPVAPGAAADGAAELLRPSSPWTLEGSEERCGLLRNFGTGDDAVQLQIDSFGRGDKLSVTLIGESVPRSMNLRDEVRYGFDADATPREQVPSTEGRYGKTPWVKFDTGFRPYEPAPTPSGRSIEDGFARSARALPPDRAFEQRVRRLAVQFNRKSRIELELGNMAEPLAALRSCLGELHQHWGLDAAQQMELSQFPIPDPAAVRAIMANYPEIMVSEQMSAYIPVRVMVDATGKPSLCTAQLPDVEGDFTTEICGNLMRRFTPAMDGAGNPVASFFQVHVLYTIN